MFSQLLLNFLKHILQSFSSRLFNTHLCIWFRVNPSSIHNCTDLQLIRDDFVALYIPCDLNQMKVCQWFLTMLSFLLQRIRAGHQKISQ